MSVLKNSISMMMRSSTAGYFTARNSVRLLQQQGRLESLQPAVSFKISDIQKRFLFTHEIAPNINYLTNSGGIKPKVNPKTMKLETPIKNPLCLMMCWLGSQPSHVAKYASIYTEQGFDVLTIRVTLTGVLMPEGGTLQSFRKLLHFIEANDNFEKLMIHGFSIGTFVWAETLQIVKEDPERYQPVLDRFNGQVWDSLVNVSHFNKGVSKAIAPHNRFLEKAIYNYLILHGKIFNETCTKYYKRATLETHKNRCTAPALIFCSKTDIVGTAEANIEYTSSWARDYGTDVTLKCFENSPHVQHYPTYPIEYLTLLKNFMKKNGLLLNEEAMNRKIEIVGKTKKI